MAIEDRLKQRLLQAIHGADLKHERALIRQLVQEFDIDFLDCAAALAHVYQANSKKIFKPERQERKKYPLTGVLFSSLPKMVRYRLEVGRKHTISKEEIKQTLIEESGVDRKMIGIIEMNHQFTVIELPEGMPTDIFYHLKSVEIKQHKLHIKRVGNKPGKRRHNGVRRGRPRTAQPGKSAGIVDA